jgi:Domain of unknown function (DUF4156)
MRKPSIKAAYSIAIGTAALASLSACTWVKPTISAENVRVAYDGNVSGCRAAGDISVSVADKVAFYHRSDLKVRDELETLARNQAVQIPADTIKAASEPKDGAQNFNAYVCGGVRVHQRETANRDAASPQRKDGEAQTFPVK